MAKNNLPAKQTLLARKKSVVKKAIVGNMAGAGSDQGLIHKTFKVLDGWLKSGDPDMEKNAVDTIVKLLPYAVDKEGVSEDNKPGAKTVNIQINNFDDFLKDRINKTNLGALIGDVIQSDVNDAAADAEDADAVEVEEVADGE